MPFAATMGRPRGSGEQDIVVRQEQRFCAFVIGL
jgi:hypothetical protein